MTGKDLNIIPQILVVDDDPMVLTLVHKIISTNLGYTVTTFTNAKDALLSAAKKVYALIISDVQMPNMDGNEFTKQLRAMPEYKFTPFILLSSNNAKENWVKGLGGGADDYLSKPFDPEILIAKIDANLKRFNLQKDAVAYQKNKHTSLENGKVIYCTHKNHKFIIPNDLILCETITVFDEKSLYQCLQENNAWLLITNNNAKWVKHQFKKILTIAKENGLQVAALVNRNKNESDLERIIEDGADDIIMKKKSFKLIAQEINARLKREISYKSKYINGLKLAAKCSPIRLEETQTHLFNHISISGFHDPFEGLPGGDFYEVYPISSNESLIAFGDVMGKKWGAWFFVLAYIAYIRSTLKILSHNLDTLKLVSKPEKILETLNNYIFKDAQLSEIFTTLSLIYVNTDSADVRIAAAGSLEPLHFHAKNNEVTTIPSDGMLLGIMENTSYDVTEINLQKGDRLAFYTDGYTETYGKDDQQMLGSKAVIETLKSCSQNENLSAKEIDNYYLNKHQIKQIDDDRTLLIITNTKN